MAHHQKHQTEDGRRGSAIQNILKMFSLSNAPTLSTGEDELAAEADEPPDDRVPELQPHFHKDSLYSRHFSKLSNDRRESLLTRAIRAESHQDEPSSVLHGSRGLSTASSHSAASMASTAELTSDGDLTGPSRSTTPSPPPPFPRYSQILASKKLESPASKVVIAPITRDDKPTVADIGEAAIEKTLGRKRCIMFACGDVSTPDSREPVTPPVEEKKPDPPKRKCMISFACPTRQDSVENTSLAPPKPQHGGRPPRGPSPAPPSKRRLSTDASISLPKPPTTLEETSITSPSIKTPMSPLPFHEFASSQDENDPWVDNPDEHKEKLTINDCMKKENAIRQLGEEAEEEAEEEERQQDELDEEQEDAEVEDDFAPSDESDGGNESDDEGGFAESDDESDSGSEYQFWAPSTTTAATSTDNLNITHFSARQRSRGSSIESLQNSNSTPPMPNHRPVNKRRLSKLARMRPGTPELPDSTDFVCGTLDEDRPLEAAYISCREQKKREKHIPIPQDIDPSFPTTDPEDNDENEGEDDVSPGAGGPMWLKDQFTGFEEDSRGRRPTAIAIKASPVSASSGQEYPFPLMGRTTHRSPPPPKRGNARSPPPPRVHARSPPPPQRAHARSPPPPRRLFAHSPTRLRSPPRHMRLRSPPGSPVTTGQVGGTVMFLAQRPRMSRTSSLPKTPNPFFSNFNIGSPSISNVASGAVTPAVEEAPRPDMHVRGPVDIVIGLEKKRQKRKEKFWRQHCRKNAKEQAERKQVPGRGAERMRELGLECAERNRGYGLGQQTQLVISL